LTDIAYVLIELGHPIESVRLYELPSVYAYAEMKLESIKKQTKTQEEAGGKRRFSHAEILAKIAKQRAKK